MNQPRRRWYALASLGVALMLGAGCGANASNDQPWQLVFEHLSGALMSVDGTSASDVWVVGADTRDGKGALVLHFDGYSWKRKASGVAVDLWWVHAFGPRSVVMAGTHGTILRYDGTQLQPMETSQLRAGQVFGIWGASENELWAVGGQPDAEPGFVWRFDGSAWSDVSDQLPDSVKGTPFFKVWGRSKDDVWIVGLDGVAVHWNGSGFELGATGTKERLFTVHGPPSGKPAFVAVGGDASAVLLEHDGTSWHKRTPNPAPTQLFGVFMRSEKEGYAVGYDGIVLEYDGSAWKLLKNPGFALTNPLHAVWADPNAGVWAVGGDVLNAVPKEGVLVHKGSAIPNEITLE